MYWRYECIITSVMRDQPVPSSFQLSDEQVAAFHADGFLSVAALTTADLWWQREKRTLRDERVRASGRVYGKP